MSLRIAMVAACPFPARRGTPLRIERLAEALIARGHEVEVITYHLCGEPSNAGYPIHRIFQNTVVQALPPGPTPAKLAFYDPALTRLIRRQLSKKRFDVIHAHHFEGLMAASWARRGNNTPLVYDAHTMLSAELPSYWKGGKSLVSRVGGWLDRYIPCRADHVVTVTEDIRDRLVGNYGFNPTSVSVAMNGVEIEHFASSYKAASAAPGRIIYTGTLAAYQGIDFLLQAFAKARAARPAMRLTIAASSDFAPYRARAQELGIYDAIDIENDDFDQLPGKLAEASVAVLPRPDCPGIPQKLLNYMAAGKAIVACEGSAKVLTNGQNGIVVSNNDTDGFAQALISLFDDQTLVGRIGSAAYDYVAANFNWNRTAQICETVYHQLLTTLM